MAGFNDLPVKSGSSQMVLSSLAAHWFEPIEDFYKEADRVLCPGGCLVIYCYGNPEFDVQHKDNDIMSKLILEVNLLQQTTVKFLHHNS